MDTLKNDYSWVSYEFPYNLYPAFKALFKMVEGNLKTEYPNGDMYSGSDESDVNELYRVKLIFYAVDKFVNNT